ncbi:MAG: hypothetical protein ACYCSR_03455 [Thiomonas sp.]
MTAEHIAALLTAVALRLRQLGFAQHRELRQRFGVVQAVGVDVAQAFAPGRRVCFGMCRDAWQSGPEVRRARLRAAGFQGVVGGFMNCVEAGV